MYIHVQSLDREDRRIEERVSKAQVPISQLPGRPKNWRTKCVDILESSISNRYCHNAIMYYGPIVLFDTLPTKFEIVNVTCYCLKVARSVLHQYHLLTLTQLAKLVTSFGYQVAILGEAFGDK